jgi:hypothetical protein
MREDPWAHWWKQQRHSTWQWGEHDLRRPPPMYVWFVRVVVVAFIVIISLLVFGPHG